MGSEINKIIDDAAYSEYVCFGGAIYSYGSVLSIENVIFETCSAGVGGGIACSQSHTNVINCKFLNCHAICDSGGAVYIDSLSKLILTNCIFEKCSALKCGGALAFVGRSRGLLKDNVFKICICKYKYEGRRYDIYIGDSYYVTAIKCQFSSSEFIAVYNERCAFFCSDCKYPR